ncbi:MAG: Gfo/Idh/MocA family oxidoreductase [Thermomicrobiales bacterium]
MSEGKTVGVAIWGAGTVSEGHLRAYLRHPHAEVVAIGSRTRSGAEASCDKSGSIRPPSRSTTPLDELLLDPKVDAVSICTPHQMHSANAVTVANAGKHLLVEKPIAMTAKSSARWTKRFQKPG